MKALFSDPVYTDFQSLTRLKGAALNRPPEALGEAAKQFEAIFIGMMLKSMRSASPGDGGLLDSNQTRFYRDMFDQQIALTLANRGGLGLAQLIEKQLSYNGQSDPEPTHSSHSIPARQSSQVQKSVSQATPSSPEDFVRQMWPHAQEAARALGVTPRVLIAQAALETGWGARMPRFADGQSSYNLFGIKADRRWSGKAVVNTTLEYEGGVPVKRREGFRAYDSYGESFRDYVAFLQTNPRYREALRQTDDVAYISALHRAGYATDARYADKIKGIMTGSTLSQVLGTLKLAADGPIQQFSSKQADRS